MPVNRGKSPDELSLDRRQRLTDYISRPMGAGKRTSSLTARLGDRSRSTGSSLAQTLRASLARSSSAYRADFTISGNRVGTNNLTGSPIANESGSATLHEGLATGSNVTPIRVPATKADLPGVPAILTRGSPLLGNRQVLMSFLRSSAFGGSADQGSSINTNSVQLDDDCDPGSATVRFQTDDEPDDPPLPPEDRGGSPLEPDDPPPEPVNFDCVGGRCVRSPTGFYDTLPECQAFCQQRYRCENGDCIPDANGFYNNHTECLNGCRSRYSCVNGECVRFPTGEFASLQSCVQLCNQDRWDCVAGECTLTNSSGEFATATDCQASGCNCTPTWWSVTIDAVSRSTSPNSCAADGNPVPGSGSPVTIQSKSAPVFSQPSITQAGVIVDCTTIPGYYAILAIPAIGDCKIEVTNVSIVPA